MNTKMHTEGEAEKSEVSLREEAVLAFWKEHDIFNKSLEKKAPKGDFIFYDGPPFATGLPHYGHILAGTIKDAVPRFWTMNGYHVPRKWGWDCHGLPLENLIEKKLGLATKKDIEEYGVKNFNEAARDAVLEYADDWREIIPRMGRWADMHNDYKTMDATYTESVWWVFSELHKKGLVYEGFKSMHLCPRCGTTLSNFEVNQGYKDIKDIAVTVMLPLVEDPTTSLLVWTTTPWTLPGNMAAAVHNEIEYVKVRVTVEGEESHVIIAKERLSQLATDEYVIEDHFKGSELVGKSYIPPFPFFNDREIENKQNAWKIYHADYVELGEEGTGAVHLAPAYGEEDMELAKREGVPIVHHVDQSGHFMEFIEGFGCQLVKPKDDDDARVTHLDADIEVLKALQESRDEHGARLFRKENITHSYPHCWRCDTPLLNYATTSWFVEVTKIKDKLVAQNKKVHWVPDHVGENRFGKWLEGARDWAVSRQRYWGAPLPVWRNPQTNEFKVFGSKDEVLSHVKKSGNQYFLMRHGESTLNVSKILNSDPKVVNGLTDKGKEQIQSALKDLPNDIDLIVYSPLQRTKESAQIIKDALGLADSAYIEEPRLRELGMGEFEGKEIGEKDNVFARPEEEFTTSIHGSETLNELRERVGSLLYEIEKNYQGKKILIVSHGDPIWILESVAKGLDVATTLSSVVSKYPQNGQVRKMDFIPLPHNDFYELDYHRPYIDDIVLHDADGTQLVRVPDVFDCWFESGAMPYAQNHYPFENLDTFNAAKNKGFPAQFIAEGLDQTRGWFYSLIVLGTALFGKSPYENVIVNGLVLAEDGKKMSKSLRNYPDPMELVHRVGADAMRFYLLSSPVIRSEDLNFSEKEVLDLQRKNIGRLHNVLAMYEMFADDTKAEDTSENVLDRWIISRLRQLVRETTTGYTNYELDKATRPMVDFIDDLSVWYLRRSRERLKSDDEKDKEVTLATLRFVLRDLSKVMAPAMPFYAEYLWGRVREESDEESVHLSTWPNEEKVDSDVLQEMAQTREVVTVALEARTKANIKVRQPLQSLRVKNDFSDMSFAELIKDEVNVKELIADSGMSNEIELDTHITPELKAEGDMREFVRAVQDMRKKKGLQPHDRINICVQTSAEGEFIIDAFRREIERIVGADQIAFNENEGEEVHAGDHSFTVLIEKQ